LANSAPALSSETRNVIMAFIEAHPELPEDDLDYCMDCIEGDIM
jgi:hypothetical protein